MVVHRIKDKLGVRSMATGEVTFTGASAELVGGAGKGFKMMADMVNLSRVYNATVAVGGMARALEEATFFGERRRAFGRPLTGHRMHLETLADLYAGHLGALALVMRCAAELDALDAGDASAWARLRMLTPLAKRHTGRLTVDTISMCMELMGGQGYIEDTGIPRLLRDAQVLPIWEGTGHMQLWDAHRAAVKENGVVALVEKLGSTGLDADTNRALREAASEVSGRLAHDAWAASARFVVDAFTTAVMRSLLVLWSEPRALLAARRLAERVSPQPWKAAAAWTDAELRTLCAL
jgi:hypothetical protein